VWQRPGGGDNVFSNEVFPASTSSRRDVEKLAGVVWFSRTSSSRGDFWIVKELHQRLFILLCFWDRYALLELFGDFLSPTNNVRPAQGGVAVVARHRHGLEVENEGHLKDFVFVEVLCTARCFFNARILFAKRKTPTFLLASCQKKHMHSQDGSAPS
jgi:hypothetical protein